MVDYFGFCFFLFIFCAEGNRKCATDRNPFPCYAGTEAFDVKYNMQYRLCVCAKTTDRLIERSTHTWVIEKSRSAEKKHINVKTISTPSIRIWTCVLCVTRLFTGFRFSCSVAVCVCVAKFMASRQLLCCIRCRLFSIRR